MSRACDFDEEPSPREQLARRLHDRWLNHDREKHPALGRLPPLSDATVLSWFAVADECIRQMEWARRCCQWTPVTWKMSSEEIAARNPLTFAPPDWKP